MTARPHAFQRRDWFTCDTCNYCEWRGLERWCAHNQRVIRWDATSFGCGEYGAGGRADRRDSA